MPASALTSDPTMRRLICRYGPLQLHPQTPFDALSRSIIAQQISTKAANTIRSRLHQRFGNDPGRIARTSVVDLRELGLSESKANCLLSVAVRATRGDFDRLGCLSDDDVVERLRTIKGIGPWTAEMFLIFALARENVWPMTDAGLRAAARNAYRVESRTELQQLGERFLPTRSLAALYLWRSLENT